MNAVPLSTTISSEVKKAAAAYCRRHGIKLGFLIERALVEQLEDEMDREAYFARRDESSVTLDSILAARPAAKKKKRSR